MVCDSGIYNHDVEFAKVTCYLFEGALDFFLLCDVAFVCGCSDVVSCCDLCGYCFCVGGAVD